MTSVTDNNLPEHPLWKFSLHVYGKPAVETALLDLQNTLGLNINLLLYTAWFGFNGQGRLSQGRVKQLLKVVGHWHDRVVKPLRRARKTAKQAGQALRDQVFQEELHAEKVEQLMLADALWFISRRIKSPPQKVADICRSILAYCNVIGVKIDQHVCSNIRVLLEVIFPMLDVQEIHAISEKRLMNKQKMVGSVGTQLCLDL